MENLLEVKYNINARAEMPKKILEEQCVNLTKSTNSIVIARVSEYTGNIESYQIPGLSKQLQYSSSQWTELLKDQTVNIQSALGEIGDAPFTYEFFLSSKNMPDYKFRIMFLKNGIMGYPLKIVLEEGIAEEINDSDCGYIYILQNQAQFLDLLRKILNSERVTEIVTRLIQMYNN